MPDIIAVTRDEIQHSFPCAGASFVLDAAEEAGLYLPSVCRHGRCGTCWATVVSGRYELAPFEAKAAPAAPGAVLLCRCRPKEDMVVRLPYRDAQIGRRHVPERRATIAALSTVAGWTALTLQLAAEGEYGQAAAFTPGQFMELHIPGTPLWHGMAMANLPNDDGVLEFLLPPGGEPPVAAWLAQARRGTALVLRGPLGRFALDEASPRARLLVGGASGLVPLLAILRHLAGLRDRVRLHLIAVVDEPGQAVVARALAPLRGALPQLTVEYPAAATVPAVAAALAQLPAADVYACGPTTLLDAVAAAADAAALPAARRRSEPAPGTRAAEAGGAASPVLTGA
jgi:ferredoxin-NADP reductase/ferredoxin